MKTTDTLLAHQTNYSAAAAESPAWTLPDYLEANNGHLSINGTDVTKLAEEYGTPLFVYSEPRLRANVAGFRRAAERISQPLKICYAAKACSNMAILAALRELNIDLEVNSGGELYKALCAGFNPDQIVFNGTSKTVRELREAILAGIYAINVDSIFELERIETTARKLKRQANVSLRLVPEIETGSHPGLQTALLTSKFGITSAELVDAVRRVRRHPEQVNLVGLHLHIGSQTLEPESYAQAGRALWQHLYRVYQETGWRFRHVNLGGGFPVNYLRDRSHAARISANERQLLGAEFEPATAIELTVAAMRAAAVRDDAEELLENLTIVTEPGRSIVSDAAVVLTAVQNIKRRPETGDTWLLTDAGYNLMLSMNNYKWYYHLVSASRANEPHTAAYKVAGPLCDSGDVYFDVEGKGRLPEHRFLPENTVPGDVLALLNCGAYSLAQMFPYNGRPLPAAVMVRENGRVDLIRRPDDYQNLIEADVWQSEP